ncbi:MAG: InlB B-repeat-containing protein [Clostridia bacterium]|nr:InlB B-repeat-containing protein [Clostridia bacterium]
MRYTHRLLSLLLVLATLITAIPAFSLGIYAEGSETAPTESPIDGIAITHEGRPVTSLTVSESEKLTVSAGNNRSAATYQWQILDPENASRYVDILDAKGRDLSLTYALIGNMLTADGKAVVRCAITEGAVVSYTVPLTVTLSYEIKDELPEIVTRPVSPLGASGSETLETFSIVINYLFDNNAIAFEPYGATVAKGSSFSATVPSPTVVGYAPFRRVGDDYIDATSVVLDYTDIQSNIVINVIYEPTLVNFYVHHHLQDLLDDAYSPTYDIITQGQALTGSTVPDGLALTEAELPGFKALAYEKMTVAADGSTVVEIRYDRNYYLIDFNMNGGFGTEPVYTRYGMTVGANHPVRHGYVFDGWELVSYNGRTPTTAEASQFDINAAMITVPNANLTYRARWITQETTYTMVFWQENAENDSFSYWGYLPDLPAMSGSYVSGADRISEVAGIDDEEYFTFHSERTDKNVLVEGDGSTVVNVYYTRNRYQLTIVAPGLCTIETNHTHGDSCYQAYCNKGHVHDSTCQATLICPTPEHTAHTDACIICGKTEHTHTSACCGLSEHTHTSSCWSNVGTRQNSTPIGAPSSPVDGQIYRRNSSNRYIYIKGSWYRYNRNVANGTIVDPTCGYDTEHTHGVSGCQCALSEHTHTDACYKDTLHTHEDHCYSYSCGEDQHIHTDACYVLICGIPEGHTHSSTCNSQSRNNTVKIIYKKYQQSLSDVWPMVDDNGKVYDDGQRWTPSGSTAYTQVLVYIDYMPGDDFTLTVSTANYNTFTMNYYLEVLSGEAYDVSYQNRYFKLYTTVKANYNYITKAEDFFDIFGYTQLASDPAFSGTQISYNSTQNGNVNFYYTRVVDHKLEFNNNGDVITDKTVTGIPFGAGLSAYDFVPDYPLTLEPNAFSFAGWYTSPGCFDGTEVDWNTLTMPIGDLMLYAKWEPIKHTVKVYKDANLTEQIGATQSVYHNEFAASPHETVENGNYIFQGWFYQETVGGETVEKAFVFTGIPVTKDLNIYAKWSSHVSVNYTVHYKLHGTDTPIADDTVGSAIAGNNLTFYAKAGSELYTGYEVGYYPLTNSHTITMSVDGTHEFTFYYVFVESMPYLVRYVDENGTSVLPDKKVTDNNLSVVTETFVRVEKMMPDAYQKRLVLVASGEDSDKDGILDANVITFHYASDEEHAYYRVVHYIENIQGGTYREYRSVDTVGEIGKTYTVDAITLTGFRFVPEKTLINQSPVTASDTSISATLGADGMLIEFYYDRNDVTYTVKYLDSVTKAELYTATVGTGMFGEQIVQYAKNLSGLGYTLVSENVKTLALSMNSDQNLIEFLYTESTVSLKYEILGNIDSGTLSITSENVQAITGTPTGSLPIPSARYHFVGWFTDTACQSPVDPSWVDADHRLVPQKAADTIWKDGTVFYAKFEPNYTDFTISVSNTSSVDTPQAFLFRVKGVAGTPTETVDLTVTVLDNSYVTVTTLPIGSYTVTEMTDWSWRYENPATERSVTLTVDAANNLLAFDNTREHTHWLDGNAHSITP